MSYILAMPGKTKIDLHVHTRGSDGHGSPEAIAAYAIKRGLDGLVITDHHRTRTPEGEAVAAACRAVGLKVFRGAEVSTSQGHCLVIGVEVETLNLGMYPELQTVIVEAHRAGGVAIVAHPYHGYKYRCGDTLYSLQGLVACEGLNGQNETRNNGENAEAEKAAYKLGLATTGGSDSHYAEHVGICYTEFSKKIETEADLVQAIKEGRCRAGRNLTVIRQIIAAKARALAERARQYSLDLCGETGYAI